MASMKICAACGKEFMALGRERYCKGPHYKPCPICGKQVLAVYWSDPPKRCDECRQANKKMKLVPEPAPIAEADPILTLELLSDTVEISNNDLRTYIGPERTGIPFKPNHTYVLNIEKEEKYGCYVVTSQYDSTDSIQIDAYMRYSSMLSIDKNFAKELKA